jgi:hypothetical protein
MTGAVSRLLKKAGTFIARRDDVGPTSSAAAVDDLPLLTDIVDLAQGIAPPPPFESDPGLMRDREPAPLQKTLPQQVEEEVAARLAEILPGRVEEAIAERLRQLLPQKVEEALAARIAEVLPSAVETALPERLARLLPAAVEEALPARIEAELPARVDAALAPRVEEALRLALAQVASSQHSRVAHTLQGWVGEHLRPLLSSELDAALERIVVDVATRLDRTVESDIRAILSPDEAATETPASRD